VLAIISMQNKSGFTLVEVLVAIVIMMVGLLGLLQSVNIALETNFKNQQRDEVVRVGESVMNDMRGKTFGIASSTPLKVPSKLRNSNNSYTVMRTVTPITAGQTDQYRVDVRYKYKNFSTYYSLVSLRGK
jgi:type IV pilus assembly protein PilV